MCLMVRVEWSVARELRVLGARDGGGVVGLGWDDAQKPLQRCISASDDVCRDVQPRSTSPGERGVACRPLIHPHTHVYPQRTQEGQEPPDPSAQAAARELNKEKRQQHTPPSILACDMRTNWETVLVCAI